MRALSPLPPLGLTANTKFHNENKFISRKLYLSWQVYLAHVLKCFSPICLKTLFFKFWSQSYYTKLKCTYPAIYENKKIKFAICCCFCSVTIYHINTLDHVTLRLWWVSSPQKWRKRKDTYRYPIQTWKSRNSGWTLKSQKIKQRYKSY